jgi:hypothetical protein
MTRRRARGALAALLWAASMLLFGRAPLAQVVEDHAAESVEELYERGDAARAEQDAAGAYRAYRRAWQLAQDYETARRLAHAEAELGLWVDAATHFRFALDLAPADETPERVARLREGFAEASGHVGEIRVSLVPHTATLVIDGHELAPAALQGPIFLHPGPRRLVARADGHRPAGREIRIRPGDRREIVLQLVPELPPAESPAAAEPRPRPSAEPNEVRTALLLSGVAATGIAGTLAVVFALRAEAADRDAIRLRGRAEDGFGANPCLGAGAGSPVCQELDNALDRRADNRRWATSSLIVTGAAAALTTATYFLWNGGRDDRASGLAVTPAVGRREGGVHVHGSF